VVSTKSQTSFIKRSQPEKMLLQPSLYNPEVQLCIQCTLNSARCAACCYHATLCTRVVTVAGCQPGRYGSGFSTSGGMVVGAAKRILLDHILNLDPQVLADG
jgi:hypothetical protein